MTLDNSLTDPKASIPADEINDRLAELDPMLIAPVGAAPSVTAAKKKPVGRQPLAPVTGLTAGQEQAATGVVGAALAPSIKNKMSKAMQAIEDEKLLKAGIVPNTTTQPAPSSVLTSSTQPKTGSGVFNYGKAFDLTDIEAGKALDMTKQPGGVHDLTTQRREALNKLNQMGANSYVENPRYGGIMTESASVGKGPRESFTMREGELGKSLEKLPPTQSVRATPTALESMYQKAMSSTPVQGAKLAGRYLSGPLAGLGSGMSFYEAYQRYMDGDTSGAVLSALAGAGGLATLVPGLQIPGLALMGGATAAQYGLDKFNQPAAPTPNPMAPPPPSVTPGSAR
ncbi:MAG: hypothetical protein WCG15_01330 [Actinomycetes bacterium]